MSRLPDDFQFPRGPDLLLWLAAGALIVGLLLVGFDGVQTAGAPPLPYGLNMRRLITGNACLVAAAIFLAAAVRPMGR